jgi:hypothetical protein
VDVRRRVLVGDDIEPEVHLHLLLGGRLLLLGDDDVDVWRRILVSDESTTSRGRSTVGTAFTASGSSTFSSSGGTDLVASGSSASFFISASVVRGTGGADLAASGSGDCSSPTPSAFFFIRAPAVRGTLAIASCVREKLRTGGSLEECGVRFFVSEESQNSPSLPFFGKKKETGW